MGSPSQIVSIKNLVDEVSEHHEHFLRLRTQGKVDIDTS